MRFNAVMDDNSVELNESMFMIQKYAKKFNIS